MRKQKKSQECMELTSAVMLLVLYSSVSLSESLMFLEPATSATYHIGDTLTIRWAADFDSIEQVVFDVSVDNGRLWTSLTPDVDKQSARSGDTAFYTDTIGTFRWIIPETVFNYETWDSIRLVSDSCWLRIWEPYSRERYGILLEAVTESSFAIGRKSAISRFRTLGSRGRVNERKEGRYAVDGRRLHRWAETVPLISAGSSKNNAVRVEHIIERRNGAGYK